MKFATILALVGAAVASPVIEERQATIDPLSASLAVFNALPTSLREMALTDPAAVVSAIASDFATGTPTWFQAIPTDVQSYFLSQAGVTGLPEAAASATASGAAETGSAAASASDAADSASAAVSSVAASASAAVSSAASRASAAASSAAASGSASGNGAMPTQVIAGGFAGVAGLMALLAL